MRLESSAQDDKTHTDAVGEETTHADIYHWGGRAAHLPAGHSITDTHSTHASLSLLHRPFRSAP